MDIVLIGFVGLVLICIYACKHDDMSYRKYYERQVVNSKHPDWSPRCGINFLERDPQWFIDNGYEEYVK